MSDYQDLKRKINKLCSIQSIRSYYKSIIFSSLIWFILLIIVDVIVWSMNYLPLSKFFKDIYKIPILLTEIICLFVTLIILVIFLIAVYTYKYRSKSVNPLDIRTKDTFDKLPSQQDIQKLIQDYEFKSNTIIHPEDTKFKGTILSFEYQYKGKTYTFETENYIKKFDNGERRIEAHVIQEDIIYPLLEGEIRNIVLYNY